MIITTHPGLLAIGSNYVTGNKKIIIIGGPIQQIYYYPLNFRLVIIRRYRCECYIHDCNSCMVLKHIR